MTPRQYLKRPDHTAGQQQQQTTGTRCTCTGGPYVHGPQGLRLALEEIAAIGRPEQQATEDADDE